VDAIQECDDFAAVDEQEDPLDAMLLQRDVFLRRLKAKRKEMRSSRANKAEVFLPDPVIDSQKKEGRKYTEEGYPIFTEEELKINLPGSGNTPLCPFDCDCCF